MTTCGADTQANALFTSLTAGVDFELPVFDFSGPEYEIPGGIDNPMYQQISKLTNADLTTRTVGGDGTFDWLMSSTNAHLKDEYEKGRITGAEYTKAYIALTQAAMASAVQYLLGRDKAFWEAANAQIGAITAKVGLASSQMAYASAQVQALTHEAAYALTKLKLATENEQYCTAAFSLANLLPQQLQNLIGQGYLINEQRDQAMAQTADTRHDGTPVTGLIGKQKLLISQQITSYMRDAEIKAGKLFADAWNVQKTIDEGMLPPPALTNPSIDEVLMQIRANLDLGMA